MTEMRFSPAILHSYNDLQNYLVGDEKDRLLAERVLDAGKTSYLSSFYSLFRRVVAEIFFPFFSSERERVFHLLEREIADELENNRGKKKWGEDWLAPSVNSYSPEAIDLCVHPPLPVKDIRCQKVRQNIHPHRTVLPFPKNTGFCNGDSLWMIRAYHKTKALFQNRRQQMEALGRLFSQGAPPEAALIHHLCPSNTLLKMKLVESCKVLAKAEREKNRQDLVSFFKNLKPGAYRLLVPMHAMTYICPKQGEGYFFDPNEGTVAICSEKRLHQMANLLCDYYEKYKKEAEDIIRQRPAFKNYRFTHLIELNKFELQEA